MSLLGSSILFIAFFINTHSKTVIGGLSNFVIVALNKYSNFFMSSKGFYNSFSAIPVCYDDLNFNYIKVFGNILYENRAFGVFLLFFRYFLKTLFLINFVLTNFFNRFVHVLSVGLGFRKRRRVLRFRRFFELYMGNRHRVSFQVPKKFYIILIRRGNIIFFSNAKSKL